METNSNAKGRDERKDSVPDQCLSISVSGPWGHFRRIEGNVVKQTYKIIPRTTVSGLLAAILGIERDGYYDIFAPDVSAIAVEPIGTLRTINMPMNTLSTADSNLKSLNGRGKISVKLPDPTSLRQQHNYEVLVEPEYRIDIALADSDIYERLRRAFDNGTSQYVPSLGLSEHLAQIEYHGECSIEEGPDEEKIDIDSAVPNAIEDVVLDTSTRCEVEESPAFMKADAGGRTTTRFTSYAYNPSGNPLTVKEIDASTVDGRTVIFV